MYLLRVKAIIQSNFAVLTDEPCHLVVWNLVHCHLAPAVYNPCFQKRLSLYKLRLGSDVAFWWFPSRYSDFREVVGTEVCFWVTCHLLPLDLWEHQSPARVTVRCGCQECLLPIQRPHLGSSSRVFIAVSDSHICKFLVHFTSAPSDPLWGPRPERGTGALLETVAKGSGNNKEGEIHGWPAGRPRTVLCVHVSSSECCSFLVWWAVFIRLLIDVFLSFVSHS